MEVKENFEVYGGAAKVERHKLTEPNQALQRMNCIVTDHALLHAFLWLSFAALCRL